MTQHSSGPNEKQTSIQANIPLRRFETDYDEMAERDKDSHLHISALSRLSPPLPSISPSSPSLTHHHHQYHLPPPQMRDFPFGRHMIKGRGTIEAAASILSHYNSRSGSSRGGNFGFKRKARLPYAYGSELSEKRTKQSLTVEDDQMHSHNRVLKGEEETAFKSLDSHFNATETERERYGPTERQHMDFYSLIEKVNTEHSSAVGSLAMEKIQQCSSPHSMYKQAYGSHDTTNDATNGHLPKGGRQKRWNPNQLSQSDSSSEESKSIRPKREIAQQRMPVAPYSTSSPVKRRKKGSSVRPNNMNNSKRHHYSEKQKKKALSPGLRARKRPRDSIDNASFPAKRRKTSKDDEMDFQWDLDDMKAAADKEFQQIFNDEQSVLCIHKSLRSQHGYSDPMYMTLFLTILVNILSPLATSTSSGLHKVLQAKQLIEHLNIFSSECLSFWGGLAMFIKNVPYTEFKHTGKFVNKVSELIRVLLAFDEPLDQISSASSSIPFLPLDDFQASLKYLNDHSGKDQFKLVLEKVGEFLDQCEKLSESQFNLHHKQTISCDEVSFVSMLLNMQNLSESGLSTPLRPNKKQGCFSSAQEYFSTHYELLKEDFLYPLRRAIHLEISEPDDDCDSGYKKYADVRLVGKNVSNFTLVYKIQFELLHKRPVNWEHSKRLIFGSLVCLSEDGFNTLIFGMVAERKLDDLRRNIVSISIINDPNSLTYGLQAKAVYQMIESPTYLKAYAPVLKQLAAMLQSPDRVIATFQKYLIRCCSDVSSPFYLKPEDITQPMNLSTVVCECDKLSTCHHDYASVDVTEESFWSDLETETLDDSQKEALRLALTHELALIQGPPGTGKTFFGVKFVEVLLRNTGVWTSQGSLRQPLIIMCYTNHALDQFLENILELQRSKELSFDMVRVGGRSKSEALKEFTLKEKLIEARKDQKHEKKHRRWYLRNQYPVVQAKTEALRELCETTDYSPINEELYFSFLHPDELREDVYQELRSQIRTKDDFEIREVLHPDELREDEYQELRSQIRTKDDFEIREVLYPDGLREDEYQELRSQIRTKDDFEIREVLHPDELKEDEYHGLRSQIRTKDDLEVREVLEWFNITTKEIKSCSTESSSNQEVYTDSKAIEDDRRVYTYSEEKSKGDLVIDVAEKGKEVLQLLFKQLQKVQSQEFPSIMSLQGKLQLFKHCLELRSKQLKAQLKCLQSSKAIADKDEEELKIKILSKADIVGFTTTGASANIKILTELYSKIMIIEEAAEIMEGNVIAALTNHTQHLVMIGDHKQLRPKAHDHTIGTKYGLEVSMFERLINNNFPHATLKHQHRMRPEISQLVRPHIYPELYDHPSVCDYPPILGIARSVYFISHVQKEQDTEDLRSPSNEHEASFLASLCYYLLQQGYKTSEITVLTPYTGQTVCLKKHFGFSQINGVRIVPVDGYQGEENDIILLSLVRSEKPGFVKEDNRVCVALSRARKGLYCIGNLDLFAKTSKLWENIIKTLKEKSLFGTQLTLKCQLHQNENLVSSSEDFKQYMEGGCLESCNTRLPCGHVCPRKCHPFDPDEPHPVECTKPCGKYCKAGNHLCTKKCNEVCECKERVEKKMPNCNHTQELPCDIDPSAHDCQEPCEKLLECGHPCCAKCGEKCSKKCSFLITDVLPCGHKAQRECSQTPIERMQQCPVKCSKMLHCGHRCLGTCANCHQGRLHIPCKKCRGRELVCGHICKTDCSQNCQPCKEKCQISCPHGECWHSCSTPSITCIEPCEWNCPHYACTKLCGEMCDRPRCDKPCEWILPKCRHKCIGLCFELCPSVCRECNPDHEAFQLFFGTEVDKDAQFIQLEDCGHLIEYKSLDDWMDSGSDSDTAIGMKKCPKCKTVISCPPMRYSNIFKSLKQDMNAIRKKSALYTQEEREQMIVQIKQMSRNTNYFNKRFNEKSLRNCTDWGLAIHLTSLSALSIETVVQGTMNEIDSLLAVVDTPTDVHEQISQLKVEYKRIKVQMKCLQRFVHSIAYKNLIHIPVQVSNNVNSERWRLLLLFHCYLLQAYVVKRNIHLHPCDQSFIDATRKELNPKDFKPCYQIQDESLYAEKKSRLEHIQNKYEMVGVTQEKMVVKALDAKQGSRYRCSNNHLYTIGQCGGAMEQGTCPECKSAIGGSNHRLLGSNTHDGTVDGSSHPAWSEGANLQNFDLNDLN